MINERLPEQIISNTDITDATVLTLYRESVDSTQSTIIVTSGNASSVIFLPKIIPQGTHLTQYVVSTKKNIIENVDTTDFKINTPGF